MKSPTLSVFKNIKKNIAPIPILPYTIMPNVKKQKALIDATRIKMYLAVAENKHNLVTLYQALIMVHEKISQKHEEQKFYAYKRVRKSHARL